MLLPVQVKVKKHIFIWSKEIELQIEAELVFPLCVLGRGNQIKV